MYFKTMGPVKLRNGFASKARMSVCMSAGDGRMLAAGRAESLYCEGQRERQGDDGPLQIYDRACGHTWTGSLVVKAVVWVGPYCWLRGSDLRTPAQRRHLETQGNVSLTQHSRDTCRACRGLEAESQTRALPTPTPSFLLPPGLPERAPRALTTVLTLSWSRETPYRDQRMGGQKFICLRMEVHGTGSPPLRVPGWSLWVH